MITKQYLYGLLVVVSMGNCARYQSTQRVPASIDGNNCKTIILESQTSWKVDDNQYQGRLTLHIQPDSFVGFSGVHPLGFEMIRGRATPSGITWINRLAKTYQQYDYDALGQYLDFRCNHAIIQAILLNQWEAIVGKEEQHKLSNWHISLETDYTKLPFLANANPKKTQVVRLVDKTTQFVCWVIYSYQKDRRLTTLSSLTIVADRLHIQIKYKKKRFFSTSLAFPFRIPYRYEKL